MGVAETIDLSPYDFVDFGCSVGSSMAFAQRAFGGKSPIGIDIDPKKVAKTRDAGFQAVVADATQPERFRGRVRFAVLSHFLEHLPDYRTVSRALRTAIHISEDFVFIRQPWFDADGVLFRHGLKFYWSDWHGHPMTLTTLQMYRIIRQHLDNGNIVRATIFGNTPVTDSDDVCVVPLSAPIDTGKYNLDVHGPKVSPPLKLDAFREVIVVLARRDAQITESLMVRFARLSILHDERTGPSEQVANRHTNEAEGVVAAGAARALN